SIVKERGYLIDNLCAVILSQVRGRDQEESGRGHGGFPNWESGFRLHKTSPTAGASSHGLSSRPELLIPEGDEKRSGGTCCFVQGQQRIGKQKQKRPGASVPQPRLASRQRT